MCVCIHMHLLTPSILESCAFHPTTHLSPCAYTHSYIDLDKVSSVEKVEATEENQERVGFTVICEGRTFQLQADDEATMQQ